jgi:hypothetical protein
LKAAHYLELFSLLKLTAPTMRDQGVVAAAADPHHRHSCKV